MSARARELNEKRKKLFAEMTQYRSEQHEKHPDGLPKDAEERINQYAQDIGKLKDQIDEEVRYAKIASEIDADNKPEGRKTEPGSNEPTGEQRSLVIESRGQKIDLSANRAAVARETDEYRAGLNQYLVEGRSTIQLATFEKGGVFAPMTLAAQFYNDLDQEDFIRMHADHEFAQNAGSWGAPMITESASDYEWTPELPEDDVSEDSTQRVGARELEPHELVKLVTVSRKALHQSILDPIDIFMKEMRRIWGNTQQKAFMTGNGNKQPLGIFTASSNGIPTSQDVDGGSGISYEALVKMKYKVPQQYRGSARWLFHRDGVSRIAQLKATDGKPIWMPAVAAGQPDTLLGHPLDESEFAPSTFSSGNYIGAFGSWKDGYKIVDSLELALQTLIELFARKNKIGILGYGQTDASPTRARAFSRLEQTA